MQRDAEAPDEFALTDAVVEQLKEQSPEGCLLCFFDAWNAEEWE